MDSMLQSGQPRTEPPIKLLIADDDQPTRMLLRAAVGQWNYEVLEADDGEEAWHALQEFDSPKILIVDWMMPKLDGISLCARIRRELPPFLQPYIILFTQFTGTANITKGLEAGADEFLAKPFNMPELRSRLSNATRIIQYEKISIDEIIESALKTAQHLFHNDLIIKCEPNENLRPYYILNRLMQQILSGLIISFITGIKIQGQNTINILQVETNNLRKITIEVSTTSTQAIQPSSFFNENILAEFNVHAVVNSKAIGLQQLIIELPSLTEIQRASL
jgi:DNA-binding response OmpR family regulator